MAVLGKRKARSEPSISKEDAAAIFRRHFEAQFAPLPGADVESKSKATKRDDDEDATSVDSDEEVDDEEEGSENDDEWGGLSDDEQSEEEEEEDQTSRKTEPSTAPATSSSSTLPEDAPSLLAQDLELRRLLAESHLLAPAINGAGHAVAAKAFDAGRTRNKATDLRIQALGSKISIHKQEKMPMNMRKGIVAAAGAREAKRRREAKENGVILERETGKKKGRRERKRDFGVDRPGVGRLKGAELRLSDRDIRGIEGSRDAFGRRGRR
ncbi:pre-rRNA processing and 40S ribosomal subunit assembly [Fusarium falciforme]|nr:pre-rRNA processing and 40S ribosomal subunit assembly [Fusarium falciforme]